MFAFFRFIGTAATAVAILSCTDKVCRIEGTVEGTEGLARQEVYFIASRTEIDTVALVDGKFSYSCPIDDSRMYTVTCFESKPGKKRLATQLIPDAAKITIALGTETPVSGSPMTEKYFQVMDEAVNISRSGDADAFMEYCKKAFVENSSTVIGDRLFQNIAPGLTVAEMDEYLAMGSERLRNNPSYERMRKDKLAAEATGPGKDFIDFSGVTPDGKAVSLSDFAGKGKLTLVDFWASWCGPCMRSMPGMVALWEKWHAKGLDIVGVAVWDGDNSASRSKIAEKGMVWPQIFVGDDKSSTEAYGISGIPHVILLDKEGRIIQRGIPNEEELDKVIAEYLK